MAQALWIVWVIPIMGELAGRTIEAVEAAAPRAYPQCAAVVCKERPDRIIAQAGRVIRIVAVVGESPGGGVEAVEAAVRAHPERAVLIFPQRKHIVVAQAGGLSGVMPIVAEDAGGGIEALQPAAAGAQPQRSSPILQNGKDTVAAQTGRIVGVMLVAGEGLRFPFIAIEPAVPGADPEVAGPVFVHRSDLVVAQAGRVGQGVLEDLHLVAVVAVQPVQRAKPHEAAMVAQDAPDFGVGETLLGGDVIEANRQVVVRRRSGMILIRRRACGRGRAPRLRRRHHSGRKLITLTRRAGAPATKPLLWFSWNRFHSRPSRGSGAAKDLLTLL